MRTRVPPLLFFIAAFLTPVTYGLEFRLLSWDGDIDGIKYAVGSKSIPVTAREASLSPAYQFTSPGPLVLFREVQRGDETIRQPVATLPIPEGFTHAILLLTATDASGTAYAAHWINDSPGVRPAQTITYENLSSLSVAIKLGKEELMLDPGARVTRPTSPDLYRLALMVAARTQNGWELVISGSQPIRRGLRTLVILRDGRDNPYGPKAPVECFTFNDLPPSPDDTP